MTAHKATLQPIEAAERMGETMALVVLADLHPDSMASLPSWVRHCLRHIGNACAQNAGDTTTQSNPARSAGFEFGSTGIMATWLSDIEEQSNEQSFSDLIQAYYRGYARTLAANSEFRLPESPWDEFARQIFSLYVGINYEERCEFVDGMRIALDLEQSIRADRIPDIVDLDSAARSSAIWLLAHQCSYLEDAREAFAAKLVAIARRFEAKYSGSHPAEEDVVTVLESVHVLSTGEPTRQDAGREFTRIMIAILDAWPSALGEIWLVLQGLTARLPPTVGSKLWPLILELRKRSPQANISTPEECVDAKGGESDERGNSNS